MIEKTLSKCFLNIRFMKLVFQESIDISGPKVEVKNFGKEMEGRT